MQKRTANKSPSDAVPSYSARASRDDEISLVDLWLIVRRRWVWLLAGLLFGVLVATAYVTLTVPTYESRASIQIGVLGIGSIEDFGALAVQLMDEYGSAYSKGPQQRMPYLKEAAEEPRRNNIMRLVAVAHSPEEARDFTTQIVAKLLQQHDQIYTTTVNPLRRRLAAIDSQIELMTAQTTELGDLITSLKSSQPAQAALVAIERARLYVELNQLWRDLVAVQQQITPPYSIPSRVVVRPTLPRAPVAPKKVIGLAVGIVFGLVLGLLAIFLKESFANAKTATGRNTQL